MLCLVTLVFVVVFWEKSDVNWFIISFIGMVILDVLKDFGLTMNIQIPLLCLLAPDSTWLAFSITLWDPTKVIKVESFGLIFVAAAFSMILSEKSS